MLDCGNEYDRGKLVKSLNELGIYLTDIHYLFLTHHHNDHTGLIHFLISSHPDIKLIMSRKCADYLKSGSHFKHENERYSSSFLRNIFSFYSKTNKNFTDSFKPYYAREKDIIIEKDDVDIPTELGITGKIIFTPGHTEDSIALLTGDLAFIGDAARNMLNFGNSSNYPFIIYDQEECKKSWNNLASSGARKLYPSHGKPFMIEKLKC
jgi:glyoxylase-like metal-dependent hydrolase (beta-lactamase superfamily II)